MKNLLIILLALSTLSINAQEEGKFKRGVKKAFKFATFYGAVTGGNSISDVDVYSVTNGLETNTIKTPFDFSIALGVRKIARLGYENRANVFYDGTERSYSDAATIGKIKGFEFLFEADWTRQQRKSLFNQHHFLRYVADDWIGKVEFLKDGFADIEYFEASERYRYRKGKNLSFNAGLAHRLAEPYGYDPLSEWMLSNGNLHYTYLALQEGYTVDVYSNEYFSPDGELVATSAEVWEAVVIPEVLSNYTEKKRNELENTIQHSLILGFDYYKYSKKTWLHAWGNLLPYHYNDGSEFSYHNYIEDDQWYDYSFGFIYGIKQNKSLGYFLEGKYNKYWNREWYDFKFGVNYVIF